LTAPGAEQPRLLLTGASGFVGSFVREAAPCISLSLHGRDVDIRNAQQVQDAIEQIHPEAVLHLAAQTFVPRSFDDPVETFEINFLGTHNLLSALKKVGFSGRFLFVSTGDVYGAAEPGSLPISEQVPPRPRNPYAVSKVAAEALCIQWKESEGSDTIIARPFNHVGPGQGCEFVVSSLAKQIVEIKHGGKPAIIDVGDIDVTRDFCDVRDVVRAYLLLLRHGRPGEIYNVCSGMERTIRSLLEQMLKIAGVRAEIKSNPAKFRPSEQRRVYGDPGKIRRDVAWEPSYPMEQTLVETIHSWEYQIA